MRWAILVVVALVLAGCGGTDYVPPPPIEEEHVIVWAHMGPAGEPFPIPVFQDTSDYWWDEGDIMESEWWDPAQEKYINIIPVAVMDKHGQWIPICPYVERDFRGTTVPAFGETAMPHIFGQVFRSKRRDGTNLLVYGVIDSLGQLVPMCPE